MENSELQSSNPENDQIDKTTFQYPRSGTLKYLTFIINLPVIVAHKHFMKPSGENVEHWASFLYDVEEHIYHLLQSLGGIIVLLIVFAFFFKTSWKAFLSLLKS